MQKNKRAHGLERALSAIVKAAARPKHIADFSSRIVNPPSLGAFDDFEETVTCTDFQSPPHCNLWEDAMGCEHHSLTASDTSSLTTKPPGCNVGAKRIYK